MMLLILHAVVSPLLVPVLLQLAVTGLPATASSSFVKNSAISSDSASTTIPNPVPALSTQSPSLQQQKQIPPEEFQFLLLGSKLNAVSFCSKDEIMNWTCDLCRNDLQLQKFGRTGGKLSSGNNSTASKAIFIEAGVETIISGTQGLVCDLLFNLEEWMSLASCWL